MGIETVAVTGGNGQIGGAVLAHLGEHGYRTVNLSRGKRREEEADAYLTTDLVDPGDVYGALARSDPDAVVHLGMVPTPERTPGHVTFESNAMSTYHVLAASEALDAGTVVLASSLSALGAGFEDDSLDVYYLPVDEAHPLTPSNPYGLGKQVLEVIADGFGLRTGPPRTITSLRFPWVITDEDARKTFADLDRSLAGIREAGHFHTARNTLFAYLHVTDAARAVRLAIEADFAGHRRFWTVADDTTVDAESERLAANVYSDAELRADLTGPESLVSTERARRTLGWTVERSWRDLPPD